MSTAQHTPAMKLGDVVSRPELQSMIGGGLWVELDAQDHCATAFVVWRMEDEPHSPTCEERARRLVAAFNACAGVPVEVLEANAAGGLPWSVADQIEQRALNRQLLDAVRAVVAMTFGEAQGAGGRLMYCRCDVLNPCWDNRPTDIVGQHWGGGAACSHCTLRALVAKAGSAS